LPALVGLAQVSAGLDATTHAVLAGNLAAGAALGIGVGLVVGVKSALDLVRQTNANRPERIFGAVLGGALGASLGGVLGSVALPVGAAIATLGGAAAVVYTGFWAAAGWLSNQVEGDPEISRDARSSLPNHLHEGESPVQQALVVPPGLVSNGLSACTQVDSRAHEPSAKLKSDSFNRIAKLAAADNDPSPKLESAFFNRLAKVASGAHREAVVISG